MPRRFQFSLRALLFAMLLTGLGFGLLGTAERVAPNDLISFLEFATLICSAFASFGSALGVIVGKPAKWAAYGFAVGLVIAIWVINNWTITC
ncbi:MAG TPA: hypothetical protein VGN42_12965 [Pirellulales bacterium]|jgi:hypothetical protein|nr:hypothetical protein [Pirellulales bacterium]